MDIFKLARCNVSEQDKRDVCYIMDFAIKAVLLDRAIQLQTETELPYSQIGILEDPECNAYATIKMWQINNSMANIKPVLHRLSMPIDQDMDSMFKKVYGKLKQLCKEPIKNFEHIKKFNCLMGQYDCETPPHFKLQPESCEQILDKAYQNLSECIQNIILSEQQPCGV